MMIIIILGIILGAILGVFFILNNKCNQISEYQRIIKKDLDYIINHFKSNDELLEDIRDRLNDRIIFANNHYNNIMELLNCKFKELNDALITIYSRLNTLDTDTKNHIIAEHKETRNEIKKQAKISSKNKSYSKTNKSTNK